MNIRKFIKIGVIPIVLVLVALLGAGPVLAVEVEPQSPAHSTAAVTPNEATNDGASVLHFSWHIWDWEGTPNYYTFSVHHFGDPTPLYIQYSDAAGTDDFPGISGPLQDIGAYSEGQDIYNPEGSGNTHDWTVPDTVAEGSYSAWAYLYVEGQAQPEAGAFISFDIEQATGNLTIHKIRTGTTEGLDGWDFSISGPTSDSGTTSGGGYLSFNDIPIGDYTVTETLKPNWSCTDPGPGLSKPATVVFNTTTQVEFANQEAIGDLVIFKYGDLNGNGVYDSGTESGLDGWAFSISGPTSDSGTTSGGGYLTFSGIPSGTYNVTETVKTGWRCTDPGASGQMAGVVVTTGTTTNVDFGNQELGDLRIFKYEDLNENGAYDSGTESGLFGWEFTVSGVPGTFVTDGSGYATIMDLVPGNYTVTETLKPDWQCTDPGPSRQKVVPVPSGDTADVQFGNKEVPHLVPTLGQWGVIILSTAFAGLLVWFGVRRRRLV